MKDNFSALADVYAQFRPGYPDALTGFMLEHAAHRDAMWDCGTGNGQLARMLAPHFHTVYATDISDTQLQHAARLPNIVYRKASAEESGFDDHQFDLITVAQAVHWFRFEEFYREVNRTLKDDGLLVITGYGLLTIHPAVDQVIRHFHDVVVGPYWDAERHYINEHYRTIPFPFREIAAPVLEQAYDWSLEQLIGYLYTWSAVKHYRDKEQADPVALIVPTLQSAWGSDPVRTIHFPTLIRAGHKL